MRQSDGGVADRSPAGSILDFKMWALRFSTRNSAVAAQHFNPTGHSARGVAEAAAGSGLALCLARLRTPETWMGCAGCSPGPRQSRENAGLRSSQHPGEPVGFGFSASADDWGGGPITSKLAPEREAQNFTRPPLDEAKVFTGAAAYVPIFKAVFCLARGEKETCERSLQPRWSPSS